MLILATILCQIADHFPHEPSLVVASQSIRFESMCSQWVCSTKGFNDCSPHENSSLFGRRFGTHNLGKHISFWNKYLQISTSIYNISWNTMSPLRVLCVSTRQCPRFNKNFEGEVVSCTWLTSSNPHSTMLWKGWGLSRVTSGWTTHDHAMCQSANLVWRRLEQTQQVPFLNSSADCFYWLFGWGPFRVFPIPSRDPNETPSATAPLGHSNPQQAPSSLSCPNPVFWKSLELFL